MRPGAERMIEAARPLVDRLTTAIAVAEGNDRRICYRNAAFRELTADDDVVGRPLMSVLPEDFREPIAPMLEAADSGDATPPAILHLRARGSERSAHEYECTVFPLTVEGEHAGVVVELHDIGRHIRLTRREIEVEQEIREINQRLILTALREQERSEAARVEARAKSDFLSAVSHELRTPLNALLGHSELLDMGALGPLAESQRKSVDRIIKSAKHLKELINDVLDFQKLESTGSMIKCTQVDASQLCGDLLVMLEGLAQGRIEVRADLPADPVWMETDVSKLRQALVNLLGNAVKFTEEGRVELRVREADDTITFAVVDTGIGIAAEDLVDIFRPFRQVDRGYSRTVTGTGLGLSISSNLVGLLGGTIRVESSPGEGSTFTIEVPRRMPEKRVGGSGSAGG